ncbi:MAG TPA: DNA primase [Phycisphaerae bacterium]|nr:DNA primase [Phycisphaerae bacterium]
MSGLYADDILDEVARANDIVEVVSGYFPLKRAGKDYVALCPFHAEKTPSFTVSPGKQIFKCFGCGRGGGVFNFVMAKENVTFPEAVRILAERAGITLRRQPDAEKRVDERAQVRRALEWAVKYFQRGLQHPTAGAPGREYLQARGIEPKTVETFRLGYAPDGWDGLLKAAERDNVPIGLLVAAGLLVTREGGDGYYDRFRGRVMFPILDPLNRPIGFGGRTLGDEPPKYMNSPETALFHKGEALYGLPQARGAIEAQRRAVVVEGYFDVLMPHQVGVENVVATLGTALTAEHVRALKRYADEVILVFDSDLAGQRAADRGMELFLAEDVKIQVAVVPQGKDPDNFCRQEGAEAFRAVLAAAQDAFAYKWALLSKEFGAATNPAAQRRALDAMLTSLLKAPALARQELSLQRDLMLRHMSSALKISEETLRAELARRRRPMGRSAAGTGEEVPSAGPAARGRRWAAERELLTALVCRPSRLDEAVAAVPADRVEDETFRRLYETLLANPSRRDGDIESVVRPLDDPALASLAVELFHRGEAVAACREEDDTGPGPLGRMLDEALRALRELEEEEELAARGQLAREAAADDTEALRASAEGRARQRGFLSPTMKRRDLPTGQAGLKDT